MNCVAFILMMFFNFTRMDEFTYTLGTTVNHTTPKRRWSKEADSCVKTRQASSHDDNGAMAFISLSDIATDRWKNHDSVPGEDWNSDTAAVWLKPWLGVWEESPFNLESVLPTEDQPNFCIKVEAAVAEDPSCLPILLSDLDIFCVIAKFESKNQ